MTEPEIMRLEQRVDELKMEYEARHGWRAFDELGDLIDAKIALALARLSPQEGA